MNTMIAVKAREGRRAALASLNARFANSRNVVSIFDGVIQRRQAVPQFHSTRRRAARAGAAAPVLLLTDPIAA